jgi:hypothetical protein
MCGALVCGAGCGGPKLYLAVERQVEPPADIRALKAIAVLPAYQTGATTVNDYGVELRNQLRSWLSDRLGGFQPHPDLSTPEGVDDAIKQGKFNRSDLVKRENATAVGQLAGADACIYGQINLMVNETTSWVSYPVPHQQIHRRVSASVTLSMVNVATGNDMPQHTKTVSVDQGWLRDEVTTVKKAIGKCVREFGETIVPCSVRDVYEVKLAGGEDKNLKDGNTYAKGCNLEAAAGQYEAAAKANPNSHGAHYNLAVAKLFLNDRAEAESSLNTALGLKVDDKYVWVLSILKQVGPDGRLRKATQQEVEDAKTRGTLYKAP